MFLAADLASLKGQNRMSRPHVQNLCRPHFRPNPCPDSENISYTCINETMCSARDSLPSSNVQVTVGVHVYTVQSELPRLKVSIIVGVRGPWLEFIPAQCLLNQGPILKIAR